MDEVKKKCKKLTESERLQNGINKINHLLDSLKDDSSPAIFLRGVLSVLGGKRVDGKLAIRAKLKELGLDNIIKKTENK